MDIILFHTGQYYAFGALNTERYCNVRGIYGQSILLMLSTFHISSWSYWRVLVNTQYTGVTGHFVSIPDIGDTTEENPVLKNPILLEVLVDTQCKRHCEYVGPFLLAER